MNKKLSGRALVIQLSSREMRIACMTLGRKPKPRGTAVLPVPEGAVEDGVILRPEAVRELLRSALIRPELKGTKNAVFILCSTQVLSETVAVRTAKGRFTSAAQKDKLLGKTLETNRDIYFPVDTRGSRLVWTDIGPMDSAEEEPAESVQLWAVPETILKSYYRLANDCGLKVVRLDYCGNSFANAVGASFAVPAPKKEQKPKKARAPKKAKTAPAAPSAPDAPAASDGADAAAVPVAATESAVAAEAAADGGAAVAVMAPPEEKTPETVLYLLSVSDFLMMTFVREGQVVHQRILTQGGPYVDELGDARMVLELYETERQGENNIRVVVCGAGSGDPEYIERVASTLRKPAEGQEGLIGTEWCLCAGVARTRLDFGDVEMNFPGRPNLLGKFWQYGLLLAAGGVLAVTLLTYFGSTFQWSASLAGKNQTLQTLEVQLAPISGYEQNWNSYVSYYNSYASDWQTLLGSDEEGAESPGALRTYNDNLVLMLEELERVLPEGVSVYDIGIAPNGLGLRFVCEDEIDAAYTIKALRSLEYAGEPLYISDLTRGPNAPSGSEVLSVLSSAGLAGAEGVTLPEGVDLSSLTGAEDLTGDETSSEEPPTKGSGPAVLDVLDGISELTTQDKNTLKDIARRVAAGERVTSSDVDAVKNIIGKVPEERRRAVAVSMCAETSTSKYTLGYLIGRATETQREDAFMAMLENPFALYLFAEQVWDSPEMIGSILGFGFLHQNLLPPGIMDKAAAAFAGAQTGNTDALRELIPIMKDMDLSSVKQLMTEFTATHLTDCEALVMKDSDLSRVLAYYLATEMGLDPGAGSSSGTGSGSGTGTGTGTGSGSGTGTGSGSGSTQKPTERDPETGMYVDPETGLLIVSGSSDLLYEKETKQYVDKKTLEYIHRNTKKLFDLRTGLDIDRETKKLIDPESGEFVYPDPIFVDKMDECSLRVTRVLETRIGINANDVDWEKTDWTGINWRVMSMDEIVEALCEQAWNQLLDIAYNPQTNRYYYTLYADPKNDSLYIDPRTGLHIAGRTGRLVSASGSVIDPTKRSELDGLLSLVRQEAVFRRFAGVDADVNTADWSLVDWRELNWNTLASEENAERIADDLWPLPDTSEPGSSSPEPGTAAVGGVHADPDTGRLVDADGNPVDPTAVPEIATVIDRVTELCAQEGIDLSSVDWSAIDWRGIDIENWNQEGLQNLLGQAAQQLSGGAFPGELGGGEQEQPQDNRIFFTVALPYKESLIQAELERRGLSRADMRQRLEVAFE